MPLRPPQPPPTDQRSWDQWTRSVAVIPDNSSTNTAQLADNAATNAKLADMAALTVKARAANSTGDPGDLAASDNGQYLQRNGDVLQFAGIAIDDLLPHLLTLRAWMPKPEPVPLQTDAQVVFMSRMFAKR